MEKQTLRRHLDTGLEVLINFVAPFVIFVALVCAAFAYLIGGGPVGIVIALVVAGGSSILAYWKSDAIALRASRAKP